MTIDWEWKWIEFRMQLNDIKHKLLFSNFRYQKWKQKEYPEGIIVQDCRYHPCVVVENSKADDHLQLMSILDLSPNGCSEIHCGVYRMSADDIKKHIEAYWEDGNRGLAVLNGWTREAYDEFKKEWRREESN